MWGYLVLILSSLACSYQASNFSGVVVSYGRFWNDSYVAVHYTINSRNECINPFWTCLSGYCGLKAQEFNVTAPGLFGGCTTVGLTIYYVSGPTQFVLSLHGLQWVNVTNDVKDAVALTRVDWRRRSDTGKANASPRSAVPHVLRVPSNCERKVTLPTIDSDGDAVACRFQNKTSVLKLTPNCTMTFIPGANVSYAEGKYAVQLIMEDFPRQNITLTDGKGNAIPLQSENALGQIPIQFLLMVDPRVESCVEGEYLPAFLPPTPANGDLLFASVDETLKIYINTIARKAKTSRHGLCFQRRPSFPGLDSHRDRLGPKSTRLFHRSSSRKGHPDRTSFRDALCHCNGCTCGGRIESQAPVRVPAIREHFQLNAD
ncbi:uncharacterized protein LOC130928618 isoform X3 [Corythoichthys intestinalis]|uniref:uncharacterized protein LOC130928618 isoform X3 n=1 Tax=Corythoichthys intestinalis TaxID=161448 RepID=UPI0025A682CF|nr:uncharacterized protein LOC130928618 isoform X3 [Corythoichthys intestinalis]